MALFEQYVTLLERQFGKRFEAVSPTHRCLGPFAHHHLL